jgi:hypothetical protein
MLRKVRYIETPNDAYENSVHSKNEKGKKERKKGEASTFPVLFLPIFHDL